MCIDFKLAIIKGIKKVRSAIHHRIGKHAKHNVAEYFAFSITLAKCSLNFKSLGLDHGLHFIAQSWLCCSAHQVQLSCTRVSSFSLTY